MTPAGRRKRRDAVAGLYRNTGVGWTRPDGTRIAKGQTFEPTEDERLRRAYKLVLVGQPDTTPEALAVERGIDDYHTGNGWYLIGGEKVQGREAASEALRALKAEEQRIRETHLPREGR